MYRRNKGKDEVQPDDGKIDINKQMTEATSLIDHITHLAHSLMDMGDTDIYSKTYEELVRSVRASGRVDPSWIPPSADIKYEYTWDVPGAAGAVGEAFGPFTEDEMKTWFRAAYFGGSGEKVKVRKVGGPWKHWEEVIF